MAKSGMATGPVTGRRPLLRWLLAATLLPGLALMLGACGTSAPVRYYTLAPVAAGVPQGATPAGSLTLIVGPIELPAYVGRPQLAVRTGEGQLEFSEFDRWAEPLEDGFQRVLVRDLAALLPDSRVIEYPFPGDDASAYRLAARISRFDAGPGGAVHLEAQWTVVGSNRSVIVSPRRSAFTRDAQGRDPAALVTAMSAIVADLAEEIAGTLRTIGPPDSP